MVDFREFSQYMVEDEEVIYAAEPFSIDRESGFKGAVTTKRVLFLKGVKLHEVLGSAISTISWETSRRNILLVPSVLLILIGLGGYRTPGLFLFFLGIVTAFFWYKRKGMNLVIYATGIKLRISGKRDHLEKLMKSITTYLVK